MQGPYQTKKILIRMGIKVVVENVNYVHPYKIISSPWKLKIYKHYPLGPQQEPITPLQLTTPLCVYHTFRFDVLL